MKENVLVFGIGKYYQIKKDFLKSNFNIVGFLDNYFHAEMFEGKKVYRVTDLAKLQYDKIVIMSTVYYMEMANQLILACVGGGITYGQIEFGQNIPPYEGDEELYYSDKGCIGIDKDGFYYERKFEADHFESKNLKIYFTSKSELSNIQTIWANGEYNILENLGNERVDVFDIGMNLGGASLWFANHKIVEKVYSVEPSESTYKRAEYNVSVNTALQKKIEMFNIGLDNYNGCETVLYNEEMSCGFSTDKRHNDISIEQYVKWIGMDTNNNHYIDVVIKNAADFLQDRIGKNKVIVKMDCEGSEYHILDEFEKKNCLQEVCAYIIEWHDDGAAYINNLLKKYNFVTISMQDSIDKGMIYAFKLERI